MSLSLDIDERKWKFSEVSLYDMIKIQSNIIKMLVNGINLFSYEENYLNKSRIQE
jgi:hypothetical protein